MPFHVTLQLYSAVKGCWAFSTPVILVTSISSVHCLDVLLQQKSSFKLLCAQITLKEFIVTMILHLVGVQKVSTFELCRALVTLKGLAVTVHKHVLLQSSFRRKRLAAQTTCIWFLNTAGRRVHCLGSKAACPSCGSIQCFTTDSGCTVPGLSADCATLLLNMRHGS